MDIFKAIFSNSEDSSDSSEDEPDNQEITPNIEQQELANSAKPSQDTMHLDQGTCILKHVHFSMIYFMFDTHLLYNVSRFYYLNLASVQKKSI